MVCLQNPFENPPRPFRVLCYFASETRAEHEERKKRFQQIDRMLAFHQPHVLTATNWGLFWLNGIRNIPEGIIAKNRPGWVFER